MNDEEKVALADRLFAAIEAGSIDGVRSCYSPETRIWHNYDDVEQTVEENLKTLGWMCGRLDDRRYEVTRREVLPDGVFQLHVLRGRTRGGDPFTLHAAMLLTMADGRITRIDEYLDPTPAAALR